MARLKAYAWENAHPSFQWARRIRIVPALRRHVAFAVARAVGVKLLRVGLTKRGPCSGEAWLSEINLSAPQYRLDLATIIHEVAHLVDHQKLGGGRGHTGTFKTALIKVYSEIGVNRKEVLRAAQAELMRLRWLSHKLMRKTVAQAQRQAEAAAYRKTRAFKMDRLRQRLARLDSRLKRLTTIRKSAARSLAAYERAERAAQEQAAPPLAQEVG